MKSIDLRALAARLLRRGPAAAPAPDRPRPFVRNSWLYTSLQFTRSEAQSRMLRHDPDRLLIDYTRTMMGVLLFVPAPARIGMVGLGGGSLVKFCHRHLPSSSIEVVEICPQVIGLRGRFKIPPDGPRLSVIEGDGAEFVRARRGRFDALMVDGYDASGLAPALSTQQFYDDCRDALAPDGVMTVNLFGRGADAHVERLQHTFGRKLLVVREGRQSNRVAFGWVGRPVSRGELRQLEQRFPATLGADARAQLVEPFARIAEAARHGAARD